MARRTFAQVLKEGKIDIENEYHKLYMLFYTVNQKDGKSMANIISDNIREYSFTGTCLSLYEFDKIYGFEFDENPGQVDIDYMVSFFEYVYNFIIHLRNNYYGRPFSKIDFIEYIHMVIENIGYTVIEDGDFKIFVPKDYAAIAVSESKVISDNVSYKIISYNHYSKKGNVSLKRDIIITLADLLEPKRNQLDQIDKVFSTELFYALNNFNIRHNNIDPTGKKYKKAIAELSEEELENWYDETYQMCLLAFLKLAHVERREKFKELKGRIDGDR